MCRSSILKRATAAVSGILSSIGLGIASPASAQDPAKFPEKPITIIMPWPAGTGIDLWHRAMADKMGKILGQPVIVDNRTGGSGTAGPAAMAATAKPDGYTISHIPITVFRFPFMQKVSWDPLKDFTYIIHMSGFLFGTVVQADSQFKSFRDMIEWSRANPGKMTYATPGAGTSLHIGMELIAKKEGIQWTQVPFKGGPESYAALLGGHVMAAAEGAGWWPHLEAGKVRILVAWTKQRYPRLPDVPTLAEMGYPWSFDSPFGIAGPKGIDPIVVKKLHDALNEARQDPKALEISKRYDYAERYMNSADYAKFVIEQVAEQKSAIEGLGLAKKD